jgi:ABC-type multidrug transport system fused ATPase/permease subunit
MKSNLILAFRLLQQEHRRDLFWLLMLMLVVALLESAGIGLLLPYIGIVNSPNLLLDNKYLSLLYQWSGFGSLRTFIIASSLLLILLFILKNLVFVFQNYAQSKVLLKVQMNLEARLMKQYLRRDYVFFTQKNPSELVQNIRNVSGIVSQVFMPALTALTELVVLAFVFLMLVLVQPWLTLIAGGFSALLLWSIFRFTRKRAALYGAQSHESLVGMVKWMYQAFGGIKEVKILSKEDFFLQQSMGFSRDAAWAGMKGTMLGILTRPAIETVWFSLTVALVLVAIMLGKDGTELLPVIALLAAAAMRIMPALNRVLNATISIRQATYHIEAVATELHADLGEPPETGSIAMRHFKEAISFSGIAYKYPGETEPVLHDLWCSIKKGQSVAFVGPSGAGKTTAVDVLLGLLEPQRGQILVDGVPLMPEDTRAWRRSFGYVPQSIYLSDDTIRNNIAFGQLPNEIDNERVNAVVEQAQLAEVLARLPQGLDTVVGDRGARLSGGQRQRIGIARALYRDPPILILDEATSALDNETEREITRAIRSLSGSKTVILIAHRLSTVAHCDMIVFLVDGRVKASGTYDELIRDCETFRRFALADADSA